METVRDGPHVSPASLQRSGRGPPHAEAAHEPAQPGGPAGGGEQAAHPCSLETHLPGDHHHRDSRHPGPEHSCPRADPAALPARPPACGPRGQVPQLPGQRVPPHQQQLGAHAAGAPGRRALQLLLHLHERRDQSKRILLLRTHAPQKGQQKTVRISSPRLSPA